MSLVWALSLAVGGLCCWPQARGLRRAGQGAVVSGVGSGGIRAPVSAPCIGVPSPARGAGRETWGGPAGRKAGAVWLLSSASWFCCRRTWFRRPLPQAHSQGHSPLRRGALKAHQSLAEHGQASAEVQGHRGRRGLSPWPCPSELLPVPGSGQRGSRVSSKRVPFPVRDCPARGRSVRSVCLSGTRVSRWSLSLASQSASGAWGGLSRAGLVRAPWGSRSGPRGQSLWEEPAASLEMAIISKSENVL